MELLELVQVRVDIIIAIVGIVETIKTIIERRQLSIYILLTLAFSFVLGYLSTETGNGFVLNSLTFFGLASFFYQAILRFMKRKVEMLKKQLGESLE